MGQLVQATQGALAAQESSARDIQQSFLVGEALRLLKLHEPSLAKAYPMALLEIFAEGPSKPGARPVDDTGMDFGELSLMDETEMHDQVELSRAQQLVAHATDAVLTELNTLVSSAQGLRSVQPERNPLRPENYIRALQRVVAESAVESPVRQLWMRHMREVLGQLLVTEYKSACASLREHGIEPVGYAVLGTASGGARRSGYGASSQSAGYGTGYGAGYSTGYGGHSMSAPVSDNSMPPGYGRSGGGSTGWQGESLQDALSSAAEEALLTVGILRQMLAGGGDPFAYDASALGGGPAQPVSLQSAWPDPHAAGAEALQDMAQLDHLMGRLSGSPAAAGSGLRGPGGVPVASAVPCTAPVGGQAYSPVIAMEVVGRMM